MFKINLKFINIYLGTLPRQISSVLDTTLEVNLIVGILNTGHPQKE